MARRKARKKQESRAEYFREWRRKNPEKAERIRLRYYMRKLGLDPDGGAGIVAAQQPPKVVAQHAEEGPGRAANPGVASQRRPRVVSQQGHVNGLPKTAAEKLETQLAYLGEEEAAQVREEFSRLGTEEERARFALRIKERVKSRRRRGKLQPPACNDG